MTLRVVNSGPVIAAEHVGGLFEPVRRQAAGRTAASGHGLGLSIVAALVTAHHGTYVAGAGDGGGLDITVTFSRPDRAAQVV